jgi:tetratricopeptide (TPR) repeat protein
MIAGGIVLLIFFSRNPIRTMPDATQDIASERALESSSFPAHLPAARPDDVQSTVPISQEQKKAEEKTPESPRGQHVEAVIRLLASGTEHENNNRFSFAHADYQEALRLDPDSEEALKAFNRVNKLIAAQAFQELMSSGFTALHNKNYGRARALFLEAQSLRPGSREVRNAFAEVDAAFRIDRIESFQQKALAHAASESWEQALEAYRAVLKLDSAIQFAIQGKERSLQIIQAEKRLNYYLDKPEVLESEQYFDKATRLLEEADKIEPKGPRFQESLQKFDKLLALARTPVEVKIESDSMTKVIVYKVGNLGRFTLRQLKLRPGTYTVVGTRDGFKDVRHKILVKHGRGAVRITVKCSQKI